MPAPCGNTLWVGDSNGGNPRLRSDIAPAVQPDDGNGSRFMGANPGTKASSAFTERHLDTACFLFAYGHVKSLKLDDVTLPLLTIEAD